MNLNIKFEPRAAAILGALIADSAALGLHWIYDSERIAQIEKTKGLVFVQPDASDYAGVSGYFAHGNKVAGDSSAYGELCLLMLQHLAQHGQFDRVAYQTEYRSYLGPGGAYVGYVDSPTRQTLQTLLVLKPEEFPEHSGADDDQFVALATIPVVVATHVGSQAALMTQIDHVVRLTNDNDTAVTAAQYAGCVLLNVLHGKSIAQALVDALPNADEEMASLVKEALQTKTLDSAAIAKRFGTACHVLEGIPVIAHIIRYAPDYRTAIEENIRIGGDSCGRAIMLGAIMAAYTAQQNEQSASIPLEWAARYRKLVVAADACERQRAVTKT
ncbi:ADP-ribosylglycohydrolase family protein [Nitrosomonas supralitoralis]|uniref:ADP-ribosylglycohydrolase family protein n=1 Tax=Nitrosomonas supralitoralis TaxID=2116706 RepID=A0A2P7NW77_9PROT|nr:ADP-ribosylglycohydrolase family protein [Nitrosomonas supralitoralis]PSJ17689.1 ADP-ribosylglycohydrolase family protein [Nitrosomonas supralitoralis]